MSESRTELLAWLNDLLQTGYTKVEQCGTGAAHCQIIDSIFHDVPMSKVKFEAKHQYEYVQNFKVLQSAFTAHKVDKVIPVERLIQCKFQDNLEFLQWIKKFWDTYYPGGMYDAATRRKSKGRAGGSPTPLGGTKRATRSAGSLKKTVSSTSVDHAPKGLKSNTSSQVTPAAGSPAGDAVSSMMANNLADQSVVDDLNKQVRDLQTAVEGLEKERDFYFGKLRDIEIVAQQMAENGASEESTGMFKEIQHILYSTEEGFEAPVEVQNANDEEMF